MGNARVTQERIEVVRSAYPKARISQSAVEIIRTIPANINVTQLAIEVIRPRLASIVASQLVTEVAKRRFPDPVPVPFEFTADFEAEITNNQIFDFDVELRIVKVAHFEKEDERMSLGLITMNGRILTARLMMGEALDGITHCAIGDGDDTFADSKHPPEPSYDQTGLRHERARKRCYKTAFLIEDTEGSIEVGGQRYSETAVPTPIIGLYFRFDEGEANGITIKEYGFFGGNVQYMGSVGGDYAEGGVYSSTNPGGQVLRSGYLYEVKNIPDFTKTSDTRVELVGVIRF